MKVLAVLAGLGLAGSAAIPALADISESSESAAQRTACANWEIERVEDDPDTEPVETTHHSYDVCADLFDDDGDGVDDRAGVIAQRQGDDGFAKWGGEVDVSAVTIDFDGGLASINASIPGISDHTKGGPDCAVAMDFASTGDATDYEGEELYPGAELGEASVTLSTDRSYGGSTRDAVANGSACGFADIEGVDSGLGNLSTYSQDVSYTTVSLG